MLDLGSLRRQGYRPEAVTSESSYDCNGILSMIVDTTQQFGSGEVYILGGTCVSFVVTRVGSLFRFSKRLLRVWQQGVARLDSGVEPEPIQLEEDQLTFGGECHKTSL